MSKRLSLGEELFVIACMVDLGLTYGEAMNALARRRAVVNEEGK